MMIHSSLLMLTVVQVLISGTQTMPHATQTQDACVDISPNCARNAFQCDTNTFVQGRCKKTCNLCQEDPTPELTTTPEVTETEPTATTPPTSSPDCGGDYSSPSGTIRHPMNGGFYHNNEDCIWTITTGKPIKITFLSFNIEDNYDHLFISDSNSSDFNILGSFTGWNLPGPVEVTSGAAYLRFISDSVFAVTGFELHWETLDSTSVPSATPEITETDRTITPQTTALSDCGGDYSSPSGTIRHPMNGLFYQNNQNCVWTITTGKPIKITFANSLDIEEDYDYLYISDGNSSDSTLLSNFTGTSLHDPVEVNSGAAYLRFTSDHSVAKTGFELQWETLEDPTSEQITTKEVTAVEPTTIPPTSLKASPDCGGDSRSPSGTILHPGNGGLYRNNEDCVWTITTGQPIKITFVSIGIEHNYDYLYIRDDNSIESGILGNFTGSNLPGPVEINSGAAYLRFKSDHNIEGTGFVLHWESPENGHTTPEANRCIDISPYCANNAFQCDTNIFVQQVCQKTCNLCME